MTDRREQAADTLDRLTRYQTPTPELGDLAHTATTNSLTALDPDQPAAARAAAADAAIEAATELVAASDAHYPASDPPYVASPATWMTRDLPAIAVTALAARAATR